ncbi:hypothetical protein BAUCODRAFT_527477 [Baudoinia panamericana UAMH 10762]|uniref:PRISE-like Rossmann-fold domain-containing protein n=1 Tax=Baudoinia panamericana (strain UAMH 10762) TaxID=717646 RepID=M2LLI2_BAUPA|nr:uncharacterized protein BAUCODRAFT_527477 [Baudoinia panamericana UAMH 10762]EMC95142.1 hypothetical protein BAUCODRAFT_527477 [Baudoinia panamericana UAMH 10762]
MAPLFRKIAFVTGANGISGNAIIEHLIRQPRSEWAKIIITSRSPLKNYWQDPRVEFVAIDFLKPHAEIVAAMAPSCFDVTHAFFTSYVHTDDFTQLPTYNVPLWENFLVALETVSGASLQRVCLQTGGKHYGAHLGPSPCPYREDMPRYDDKGENFYYKQEDFMFARQKNAAARGHQWHYSIIRPNGIIGFTPAKNGMSEAITMALYFLINRELGTNAPFPGNQFFYNCVDDCSSATGLADISVWAMSNEHTKDEAFNSVNGDTYVWRYFWPRIADYFGAKAIEPEDLKLSDESRGSSLKHCFKMGQWADDKREVWDRIVSKYGGDKAAFDAGTWGFFDWATGKNWPTVSSMSKARAYGYTRADDTYEVFIETFRTFENAGILPPHPRRHLENFRPAQTNGHANDA